MDVEIEGLQRAVPADPAGGEQLGTRNPFPGLTFRPLLQRLQGGQLAALLAAALRDLLPDLLPGLLGASRVRRTG